MSSSAGTLQDASIPSCSVPARPSSAASRPSVPSWVAPPPKAAGGARMSAVPCRRITGPGRSTTSSAFVFTEKPASGRVPRLSPAPNAQAPGSGDHLNGSVTEKTSGTSRYQPYQSPLSTVVPSPSGTSACVTRGDMFMANRPSSP